MKVFKDIFTRDELFCDTFKFEIAFQDAIMKAKSQYKKKEDVGTVDIGCGNAFGGDEEEAGDVAGEEKVNDIAYNGNLTQTNFSKGEFMTYIKNFLKKLKAYLEANEKADRVTGFMAGAQEFVKFVVANFEGFEFFTGASDNLDGSIAFSFWEDESAAGPVFYFFKDSLVEEKL